MLCEKHDNTMSERPTPETDTLDRELHNPKVLSDRYSIMRDHSNNLERQRNNLQDQRDLSICMAKERERERDEAIRALTNIAALLDHNVVRARKIAQEALKHLEAAK